VIFSYGVDDIWANVNINLGSQTDLIGRHTRTGRRYVTWMSTSPILFLKQCNHGESFFSICKLLLEGYPKTLPHTVPSSSLISNVFLVCISLSRIKNFIHIIKRHQLNPISANATRRSSIHLNTAMHDSLHSIFILHKHFLVSYVISINCRTSSYIQSFKTVTGSCVGDNCVECFVSTLYC
jgi:hypothetical protein